MPALASHRPAVDSWAERMESVTAYAQALRAVIDALMADQPDTEVSRLLDSARVSHGRFASARAVPDAGAQGGSQEMATVIRFTEALQQALDLHGVVSEWLATATRPLASEADRLIDQRIGLHVDPRFDVILLALDLPPAVAARLVERGYQRLLHVADILNAGTGPTADIDLNRLDRQLDAMDSLLMVPPLGLLYLQAQPAAHTAPILPLELIHQRISARQIGRKTLVVHGGFWATQFFDNLPTLVRDGRSYAQLQQLCQGGSALVVGAGPSLDREIGAIAALSPRPLIICAFKAMKALCAAGITPDFVVMMDARQRLRHLDLAGSAQVGAFVVESCVSPDVLQQVQAPLFAYCSSEHIATMALSAGLGELPFVSAGGSVIHVALRLAVDLGCRDIGLVGVDFGYPAQQLYAQGAGLGDPCTVSEDGSRFIREPLDAEARSSVLTDVRATDGSLIKTSLELTQYREWTEAFIASVSAAHPDVCFWNGSTGGADIAGAPYCAVAAHGGWQAPSLGWRESLATLPKLVATAAQGTALARTLQRKIRSLDRFAKLCRKARRKLDCLPARQRPSAEPQVLRCAADVPELSLALAPQVMDMDEQAQRSTVDVASRLHCFYAEAQRSAEQFADQSRRSLNRLEVLR